MIVNNWFVTVAMFTDILGEYWWVRLYFVSFWIGMVLIQLNILIALVLEIYSATSELLEAKYKKKNL